MKRGLLACAFLLMVNLALAQAPQGIPYQAVARNSSGLILASTAIRVRFTIHDSIATGTIVYRETFNPTTSAQGLFNVNVGTGTIVSGTFIGINWGTNAKFMQVEMDPTGGTSYIDMGTQQMMSVPYALYSKNSASLTGGVSISNSSHGSIQISTDTVWIIPNGLKQIDLSLMGAIGGQGGNATQTYASTSVGGAGGGAGFLNGTLLVNAGDSIKVIFGLNGTNAGSTSSFSCCSGGNGGNGGATYLYKNSSLLAIINGGTGGSGGYSCSLGGGHNGSAGSSGNYDVSTLLVSGLMNVSTTNVFSITAKHLLIRY